MWRQIVLGAVAIAVIATWVGGLAPTRRAAFAQFSPIDSSGWKTNFKKTAVSMNDIRSGGPPKDGIPPIDRPKFESVAQADSWLKPLEPVVFVERDGDARVYPLQILIWHEIVNDTVGKTPVTVTFCPLCNTSLSYDRRLDGKLYDFGTTGKLYRSALVMYDRQTETWWWQVSGRGIVGDLVDKQLTLVPSQIISYETFKQAYPGGKVLSRDTGHSRAYGRNPYVGYDDVNASPFLYTGPNDARLRPMERVVTVSNGAADVAYPFSALQKARVVNDTVGGRPIVVFHQQGTASALDREEIASSRDIGAAAVFSPIVDGRKLTFAWRGDKIVDEETKSVWTILGIATAGPHTGKRLEPIAHGNHFWFSWASYKPKTRVYQAGQ
jgi:hypothetical protein